MSDFVVGYARGSNIKGIISLEEKEDNLEGRWCLYESELGVDLAKIICQRCVKKSTAHKLLGKMIRLINDEDVTKIKNIRHLEEEAGKTCSDLIKKHQLPMKIVRTILSFDEKRLTFYFISEERVDFRSLVRDLVLKFHKMIRLQQIGPRDHTRIINGVGICGRELCCSSYLFEVGKITKETAAKQGMEGLSSDKISGCCGKLMCCLRYEIEDYDDKNSKFKIPNSKQAQNSNDQNTKSF